MKGFRIIMFSINAALTVVSLIGFLSYLLKSGSVIDGRVAAAWFGFIILFGVNSVATYED